MITYIHKPEPAPDWGGAFYPVIVCDACKERITKSGNTYWLVHDDDTIHPQLWHTHKQCARFDEILQAEHGGSVLWEELDRWLDQLATNFRKARP